MSGYDLKYTAIVLLLPRTFMYMSHCCNWT